MLKITFIFVGEGSSDRSLIEHLEQLCLLCGADEAMGTAPDLAALPYKVGHTVADKLRAALSLQPIANLLFVHRDADARETGPRYQEIAQAVHEVQIRWPYVAVVPVQMTEAWLLLDEAAIRRVADNPNGRVKLAMPGLGTVENIADPKEKLWELLRTASELSGRRLAKFEKERERRRGQLLRELPVDGSVCRLPSWQRLRDDLTQVLTQLQTP